MSWRKYLSRGGIPLVLIVLVVYGFWPEAVRVQTEVVRRAPLEVTIDDQGVTRLKDEYVISAPAAAYLERVILTPGDSVSLGDVVATLSISPLDPRTRAQAEARVEAAKAASEAAAQRVESARAQSTYAARQLGRMEDLYNKETATEQVLDEARTASLRAESELRAAEASLRAAQHDVRAAQAVLAMPESDQDGNVRPLELKSPVDGVVVARYRESAGLVQPGQPLVGLGNPSRLEVKVDVISSDAVRIQPGNPVRLERWGQDSIIQGIVRRIEPKAFTEISSLGVEQQRVPVVVEMIEPPDLIAKLGANYRVVASFVVWSGPDVLQVPASSLFRTEDGWAVFAVDGGRAHKRSVNIGRRTGLAAQVLGGIRQGERVITHPGENVIDGKRVEESL